VAEGEAGNARAMWWARLSSPARALALFWAVVLMGFAALVVVLALLGAPPRYEAVHAGAAPPATEMAAIPSSRPAPAATSVMSAPGVPPAADPALLEAAQDFPGHDLPRIGPDGRKPMQVYAGAADRGEKRPRVGLVLGGIGLSAADSTAAIEQLPAAVTLAFSPYAQNPMGLAQAARARGHEILISLPLEPQGYPLNDEGPETLLTGAAPADNARRLEWALSRLTGYAGATGALDGLHGERFAGEKMLFEGLQHDLAARGLFYIDPRPGAAPPEFAPGRAVDLVVDAPPGEAAIAAALEALSRRALEHGTALGLADLPRPVTVSRIAIWAGSLTEQGLALVPASALVAAMGSPAMGSPAMGSQ